MKERPLLPQAELPLAQPVALAAYVPKKKKQIRAAWWFSKMRSEAGVANSRNSETHEQQKESEVRP